jgi:hypothetical protein
MKVSKFIKPHKDILLEYIYDDGNNISDSYKILQNLRDNTFSYVAGDSSSTGNTLTNQLFLLGGVSNNYGLVNTTNYSFLQLKDYSSGFPVRHDTIKVYLPINWTFGEYLGFYIKVYTYDYNNKYTYALSTFFFDSTNLNQSYLLNYNTPALLFQEKLWGKNITINVPSVYSVAKQRQNDAPKLNSLNYNLTNGLGLSLTSPIFIDFHFITQRKTINNITTYFLTAKTPISLPQTPDFENIGTQIIHSTNGDYFEIYGVFNGDINQFDNFINDSIQLGKRYYVTYNITLYEQNIRGKSFIITVTENFNEKIDYRPIIKYSTTTAIIDVEMYIIDAVDNTSIYRRASYGMLQDEVAKYSLNLTKINLANASKPKIYNIKSPEGAGIFGNSGNTAMGKSQIILEPIKINYTVLSDRFNVVAKSENVTIGSQKFYGIGKLQLLLQPFDNIIQLKIAQDFTNSDNTTTPTYLDMSNMGEIKLVIKNQQLMFETGLYLASNQVELTIGMTVFKIPASRMNDIRKIYDSGLNVFYVTAKTDTGTVVVYSGLYIIYDSKDNVNNLRNIVQASNVNNNTQPSVIIDPSTQKGTAIVTRSVGEFTPPTPTIKKLKLTSFKSMPSSTIISKVTYTIGTDSSLSIDGYKYTSNDIKIVLGLPSSPTNLSFNTDALYSNGKYLDKLVDINKKLYSKLITTNDKKEISNLTQQNFKATAEEQAKSSGKLGNIDKITGKLRP